MFILKYSYISIVFYSYFIPRLISFRPISFRPISFMIPIPPFMEELQNASVMALKFVHVYYVGYTM